MGIENHETRTPAQIRFGEFLEQAGAEGMTQAEIAQRTGVPPQYISDIKAGRRSVTELFARRIEEEFGVDYEWLRGEAATAESRTQFRNAGPRSNRVRLPVFPHPIEGEPYAHRIWDGSEIEVCGAATARLIASERPYVLRFGASDQKGRLRKNDFVLVSQSANNDAEIHVLKEGTTMYLARRKSSRTWEAVAPGKRVSAEAVVAGHCIGIIWGSLCAQPGE